MGLIASFHTIIYAYGRQIYSLARAGYYLPFMSLTNARKVPHMALYAGRVQRDVRRGHAAQTTGTAREDGPDREFPHDHLCLWPADLFSGARRLLSAVHVADQRAQGAAHGIVRWDGARPDDDDDPVVHAGREARRRHR